MKKKIIIILLVLGVLACNRIEKEEHIAFQNHDDATLVISIPKAGCKICKKTIEEGLQNEIGVQYSNLDLNSKNLAVIYRPDRTTRGRLEKVVKKLTTQIPCK